MSELVSNLPSDFPVPIGVAQHLSPDSPSCLIDILNRRTALAVFWAKHEDRMAPGNVYVAPPGHHVQVRNDNTLSFINGPRVLFVRPSADLLFISAAAVNKDRTIGIVLSGSAKMGLQEHKR